MAQRNQIIATMLLLAGVGLVFTGMSSALNFSLPGIIAAVATIAGLLYAGGVWFGGATVGETSALIFDRRLIIVGGAHPGRPIGDAFDGRSTRFSIPGETERRRFEVAPIRSADGFVAYGILLSGAMVPAISQEQLTPVA
jgi:hypothetical protein